jgi:hypothetical protein
MKLFSVSQNAHSDTEVNKFFFYKSKYFNISKFFTIGLVATSVLITRLLKFKASSCTITQYIEQILSFHLKNKNKYFQLPVIILTFLNCILICFIIIIILI